MKKQKLQKKEKKITPYDLPRKKKKSALKLLREIVNKPYVWDGKENEL